MGRRAGAGRRARPSRPGSFGEALLDRRGLAHADALADDRPRGGLVGRPEQHGAQAGELAWAAPTTGSRSPTAAQPARVDVEREDRLDRVAHLRSRARRSGLSAHRAVVLLELRTATVTSRPPARTRRRPRRRRGGRRSPGSHRERGRRRERGRAARLQAEGHRRSVEREAMRLARPRRALRRPRRDDAGRLTLRPRAGGAAAAVAGGCGAPARRALGDAELATVVGRARRARRGRAFVPLNPKSAAGELDHMLGDAAPEACSPRRRTAAARGARDDRRSPPRRRRRARRRCPTPAGDGRRA